MTFAKRRHDVAAPFFPVSFGKSCMRIRSAVAENGCLIFLADDIWRIEMNCAFPGSTATHCCSCLFSFCYYQNMCMGHKMSGPIQPPVFKDVLFIVGL